MTTTAESDGLPDFALSLAPLFDFQPGLFLYVKDAAGRFVHVNRAWLDMRGFDGVEAVRGLTDFDLHPHHLAARYVAEDAEVRRTRRTLPNRVWLVPAGGGSLRWFLSTKTPLFAADESVCGIAGAMRDFEAAGEAHRPFAEMQDVLAHVVRNVDRPVRSAELAEIAGLSISQFERNFKRTFQMTPRHYVQQVRANAAAERLVATEESVAEVAAACGYCDQSHLTKQLKRHLGETPLKYRKRARLPG